MHSGRPAAHRPTLPHLVKHGLPARQHQRRVNHHDIPNVLGRDALHFEAQAARRQVGAVPGDGRGVRDDTVGGVVVGDEGLGADHLGTVEVEGPGDPGGGVDASVAVGDVDGGVGSVVGPVEEGGEVGEGVAGGEDLVACEGVVGACLGGGEREDERGNEKGSEGFSTHIEGFVCEVEYPPKNQFLETCWFVFFFFWSWGFWGCSAFGNGNEDGGFIDWLLVRRRRKEKGKCMRWDL